MPRAPVDWKRILRRAAGRARLGDRGGIDALLAALRWRYDTARNAAVAALAALRPPPVRDLLRIARSAETAVERRAAVDALARTGDPRGRPGPSLGFPRS